MEQTQENVTEVTKEVAKEEAKVPTFDEFLSLDKNNQAEFDRRVTKACNTAIENAKANWTKEEEEKRTEAERLAKLSTDERHKEELEKERNARITAEAKVNAYELRSQAEKDNQDIPVSLFDLIDFNKCNTADLVQKQIDTIKTTFNKAVEDAINEQFKEKTPKSVVGEVKKSEVSRIHI